MIAVCLEEGEESVSTLEQVYETKKWWVHSIKAGMVEKWEWKVDQDMHELVEEGMGNKEGALK